MIQPYYCQSLAFILSFMMTFVIYYFRPYQEIGRPRHPLYETGTLTFICQCFAWPLLMRINYIWNPVQVIFISLFTPIFSHFFMPAMMVTTLLIYLLPFNIDDILVQWSRFFFSIFDSLLDGLSGPFFQIRTGYLNDFIFLLFCLMAMLSLKYWSKIRQLGGLIIMALYLLIFSLWPYIQPVSTLTLIDVDQGDACLFQAAFSKENYLIDTGGRTSWQDQGTLDQKFPYYNLIPALKALGLSRINHLILTHPDMDHIGSLPLVSQEFKIDQIYISQYCQEDPRWQDMARFLPPSTKVLVLEAGAYQIGQSNLVQVINLGDQRLLKGDEASNDSSLVTLLQLGSLNYLGTGDLSQYGEKILLEAYPNLRAYILKLGHHGSRTSTSQAFIKKLSPCLALISAGEGNRYGHPHPEVLKNLADSGIPYLSSHESGAIRISYNHWTGSYDIMTAID